MNQITLICNDACESGKLLAIWSIPGKHIKSPLSIEFAVGSNHGEISMSREAAKELANFIINQL